MYPTTDILQDICGGIFSTVVRQTKYKSQQSRTWGLFGGVWGVGLVSHGDVGQDFIITLRQKRKEKNMDKLFNHFSLIVGVVGGWASFILGGWDVLLKTILFLAVVDYATGIIKGVYTKELSSSIGFKGLLKKIVMFIVIATAYVLQNLMGDAVPLREIVIMFYIANEGISLLENAAIFVPIPDRLKSVLLQLRKTEEN